MKSTSQARTECRGLVSQGVKGLTRLDPLSELIDPQATVLAILECWQNNDAEGVMEMISIYLNALHKSHHLSSDVS